MTTTTRESNLRLFAACMLACTATQAGCSAPQDTATATAFAYDRAALPGAKPWTSEDFNSSPDNFQFAIIGDRTGGANVLGTFRLALNQLSLLQPEFVINVGDLIEGYSDQAAELSAEWDETDAMLANLQVPFFRTPGNHDISNAAARQVWRERFGATYYWFVYRDVLFMVLDSEYSRPAPPPGMKEKIELFNRLQTEDPPRAQAMLDEFMSDEAVIAGLATAAEFPEEQVAWVRETLAANPDVRWTFVFLHEPAWEKPSASFTTIQDLLRDRDHTVFAGHLHYYDYDNIDGVEYITMGPSGASFHHEGPGNVDHIMWVTMTDNGPQMGNIALKGLFDRRGLDTAMFGAYDRSR